MKGILPNRKGLLLSPSSVGEFNEKKVNDGIFTWRWNDKKYLKRKKFVSDLFKIGGFLWKLEAFPNDTAKTSKYKIFNLYLVLPFEENKDMEHKTVTVNLRLYQYETGVSWTHIFKFGTWKNSKKNQKTKQDGIGWSDQMLRADELNKFNKITIGCYIKILCIKHETENKILYQCPMRLEHPLLRRTNTKKHIYGMRWQLTDKERELMKNAKNGQCFEGLIRNETFCFRVFPNGINPASKGQVILCLALCLLPPGISKITTRLQLKCKETKTQYQLKMNKTDKLSYTYDANFYHWPEVVEMNNNNNNFKPLYMKEFNEQKQITFIAKLEVLKHYDLDNKEIKDENDWKEHYKLFEINKVPKDASPPTQQELAKIRDIIPAEIRWHINDIDMILTFYDMKSGGYFDSTICEIKGLKWFLRLFPRGNDAKNESYCSLFLCLYELPENMDEIIINMRLFCNETDFCSHTDIVLFDKDNWCHGINVGDMTVTNLLLKGMITIGCYINIIKIICIQNIIIYQNPTPLLKEICPYIFKWYIDEQMLCRFLQCDIGKKYESSIYDEMYCFKCFPNGMDKNSAGMIQLFIQQCMFPENISKIKLKIKFLCPELNKIWSTLTEFDINGKTEKAWNVGILLKKELNGLKTITFIAEITVIEQLQKESKTRFWIIAKKPSLSSLDGNYHHKYFQNKHENKLLDFAIYKFINNNTDKICKLIKKYYPSNIYEWDIKNENLLNRFIVSNIAEKYESDIFEIGGFRWFLKIFPNGFNRKNRGYFQIFLTLASLPILIKSIFTNVRISCHQTMTSYTFFARFTNKHKTWGWHRNLSVAELHELFLLNQCKRLTFQCQIKILKVINPPSHTIYQYLLPQFKMDNIIQYKWHINESMMNYFRKSPNGKMFESEIFEDMFTVQIYPNGVEQADTGNVEVFCQICSFPKGIIGILVKLELLCIDNGANWQHIVKFSEKNNNFGWTNGTITTNELYDYDELTFQARIQFIELFDEKGMETNKIWKTYENEIDDAHHDEKTPHEHDSSHQFLELINSKIVQGYIRLNVAKKIFNDNKCNIIIDLITKYIEVNEMNELFDWNMNKPLKTINFAMSRSNPLFISDVFQFYSLHWVLESYVASREDTLYRVMLTLCSMPSVLSQVVISYRIYCNQTMSSITAVSSLNDNKINDHDRIGYNKQRRTDKTSELSSGYLLMKKNDSHHDELKTFVVAINILKIKDNDNNTLYEYPFNCVDCKSFEKFKFEWKINEKMIEKFSNSYSGQTFESPTIYDQLWCLGLAPYGLNEEGEERVILYIQLCSMPIGVKLITVQCQMKCIELDIDTQSKTALGIKDDKISKIEYCLLKTKEFNKKIKEKKIKELRIFCEIQIVHTQQDRAPNYKQESLGSEKRSARSSKEYSNNRQETLL